MNQVNDQVTTSLGTVGERSLRESWWQRAIRTRYWPIVLALVLLIGYFSMTTQYFLSFNNMVTILSQVSVLGIAAVGETMVILLAGIDLSVGAVIALAGVLSASWALNGAPVPIAMLAAVGIGLAVGVINGVFTYIWRMASFIVTLAMMSFASGMALIVTGGSTVFGFPNSFNVLGSATIGGIPLSVGILVLVFVLGHLVLRYTSFGRQVYAVGGNVSAARLSGVNVVGIGIVVFAISGGLAGLASIIEVGRLASAIPIAGQDLALSTIAAVIIGGTSLFGGVGTLPGTALGVLLIGILNNGLAISNVSAFWDQAIQGIVIFVAVAIDAWVQRRVGVRS
ncbi:MAG: ABC transporter permease [Bacilli bacterium]